MPQNHDSQPQFYNIAHQRMGDLVEFPLITVPVEVLNYLQWTNFCWWPIMCPALSCGYKIRQGQDPTQEVSVQGIKHAKGK